MKSLIGFEDYINSLFDLEQFSLIEQELRNNIPRIVDMSMKSDNEFLKFVNYNADISGDSATYQILNELLDSLLQKGLLDDSSVVQILDSSPANRWL